MKTLKKDVYLSLAGVAFGLATTFRGNGLLSGLIFVFDAVTTLIPIIQLSYLAPNIRRLTVTLLSGFLMACIALTPQFIAYKHYCKGELNGYSKRPWCSKWIPSIFAWVQKEYW